MYPDARKPAVTISRVPLLFFVRANDGARSSSRMKICVTKRTKIGQRYHRDDKIPGGTSVAFSLFLLSRFYLFSVYILDTANKCVICSTGRKSDAASLTIISGSQTLQNGSLRDDVSPSATDRFSFLIFRVLACSITMRTTRDRSSRKLDVV